MTGRSLQASVEGITKAKAALIRYSLTQTELAAGLSITRQPVSKFFQGKPVDRQIFVLICERLNLDWDEIVASSSLPNANHTASSSQIDNAVQSVRATIYKSTLMRCSPIRVLDMNKPVNLKDIYTNVNVLDKIAGRRRKEIDELVQDPTRECSGLLISGLEAVEKYPKLIILGKLGAGKTTFLRYLAIQCLQGEFHSHRVPVFVSLKDFAEAVNNPGLLEYISIFVVNGEQDKDSTDVSVTKQLLSHGRTLILLDGLDEVRNEDTHRVFKEIREFSDRFPDNHFIITSRIAAVEYNFESFTEVEVAGFDEQQIADFAAKWYRSKTTINFLQKLAENQLLKELATNPLLLVLLCLVFEERNDFPVNLAELYKEVLDVLLKKWDAKRCIQRNQAYQGLSGERKEDLLSEIAWSTFVKGDRFFKQKVLEQQIRDYIDNLPDANTDPQALQIDTEAILKSIEAHHSLLIEQAKGIYSFPFIALHEYLVARKIVSSRSSQAEKALENLATHITENRWQNVFSLTLEMLPNPDYLLQLTNSRHSPPSK
ncbi:MAG: NACHT domain-containing protein [Aetokthonos hydrillicola CCALA 1050]|jgi:predicted NACHT family NTPase|nr:NACHT domain-containing NTPase [Aetokthonos hydrillicola CCALA 1050]MBW4588334.1 NACHT domain-containing protein [Aetokthonos hydrillicola CCALA 1050]